MRHVPTLIVRELGAYFASPIAYLILLAVQLLAWSNFWLLLEALTADPIVVTGITDPMNTYLSGSIQFWITIMFAAPAITMRLISEERKSGTLETLLTAPVMEWEVVLAKWTAGLIMYLTLLLPYFLYLPFLSRHYPFDPGPVFSLGIGLTTIGMMFIAVGVFFSALTKNQIVAGMWTFATLFVLIIILAFAQAVLQGRRNDLLDGLNFLGILWQTRVMGSGQLDLRHLAVHLSVTAFMLYGATQALRLRRQ